MVVARARTVLVHDNIGKRLFTQEMLLESDKGRMKSGDWMSIVNIQDGIHSGAYE